MQINKVPFGLLDGRMVSPAEVPQGLACGCVCAGCNGRLIARHPTKGRVKHFAHYQSVACAGAYETALHKAAKQLISESDFILVPELSASAYVYDLQYGESAEKSKTFPSKLLALNDVQEESRDYSGIVPDIVATIAGRTVFIEIAVTHPTGKEKLARLNALGHPAFEITLLKLPELPTKEELKELVLHSAKNRKWLFNPKQEELEEHVKDLAETELKRLIRVQQQKHTIYEEQREKYRALSDNEKLQYDLRGMGISWEKVSPLIGHQVKCAFSIKAALETWQLCIFRRFVHKRNYGTSFDKEDVYKWIAGRFEIKPTAKIREAPQIAIYYYLQVLMELRLIERGYSFGDYVVYGSGLPE